ncbi:hypothetical protein M433DRAFT_155214 [Acidomyces richmondensis BFW]|nr:MAG: hypothetical protein FE78DRAFT_89631 [Acidomyces sp. 'richmondensis']KYG44797.1 hypothetical protein M433DRAFT_155214 [Acidomyces richmondensis BFW]
MSALQPPHINTTQDPTSAADFSESDDHFSSASEGGGGNGIGSPRQKANRLSTPSTPITRVERVDSQPAYGEVPGTAAYAMRTQDAVPDEIEVVPDGQHSRNRSRANSVRPSTPGGTPIPRTVVEKVDDRPAYGEVEGTLARDMRMADALPDEVRRVTEPRKNEDGDVVAEGTTSRF